MEINSLGFKISNEQMVDIKNWGLKLQQIVKNYQISNEAVDGEAAKVVDNEKVFTIVTDWIYPAEDEKGVYKCGFGLVPGFHEDCDDYFIAQVPFGEEPDTAYTELRVMCIVCDGEFENEDGDECDNCEDGELVFDLMWNDEGVVSAALN